MKFKNKGSVFATGVSAILAGNIANAEIVSWSGDVTVTGTEDVIYFDFSSGGAPDSSGTGDLVSSIASSFDSVYDFALWNNGAAIAISSAEAGYSASVKTAIDQYIPYIGNTWAVAKYAYGDSIGSGVNYLDSSQIGSNHWDNGATGYIGVVMNGHYGWVEVTNTQNGSMTLHGYAYETQAGVAIAAGAVPEPETFGLMAALAAGSAVVYKRRRRKNV